MPLFPSGKKFAPSFVITLSALPACAKTEQPKPPGLDVPPPTTSASAVAAETPPETPSNDRDTAWTFYVEGTTCFTSLGAPCAKDDANCKAAPKQPYTCPKALEYINPQDFREIFRAAGHTTCMLMYTSSMDCPRGASCNPPRPQNVPCPEP